MSCAEICTHMSKEYSILVSDGDFYGPFYGPSDEKDIHSLAGKLQTLWCSKDLAITRCPWRKNQYSHGAKVHKADGNSVDYR